MHILIVSWIVSIFITMFSPSIGAEEKINISKKQVEKSEWTTIFYSAKFTTGSLQELFQFESEITNNKIYVLALTRKINTFYKKFDWEVEGQISKNVGPRQKNWGLNIPIIIRWNILKSQRKILKSIAAGVGLSYASEPPVYEIDLHGDSSKLLLYNMVEIDFFLPNYPSLFLVARIHHRSSMFQFFNKNIRGASNALGLGLKYKF
jgi:hypothetical protein